MEDNIDKAIKACQDGNISIIMNMFINGIELNQLVLEEAASAGRLDIVQYLIETCGLKALANNREASKRATNNGHAKVFFYLQKKGFEEINKK